MKIQEKDHLIKQMEDDKRDLSTQLDEAKKETENIRKTLEEEHQQAVEQLNVRVRVCVDGWVGVFCVCVCVHICSTVEPRLSESWLPEQYK